MQSAILRLPATLAKVGLRRSMLYLLVRKGKFPKPVKLGERASGWLESEIDDWVAQRIAEREAA